MEKNLPANAGNVRLGFDPWLEDPLGEGMAIHPSILARRIPLDRGNWRLQSTGHKILDTTEET